MGSDESKPIEHSSGQQASSSAGQNGESGNFFTRVGSTIRRSLRRGHGQRSSHASHTNYPDRQASQLQTSRSSTGNTEPHQETLRPRHTVSQYGHVDDPHRREHVVPSRARTETSKDNDICLLFIGCKRNGKSHTGNTILGQEVFKVTRKGGTQKTDGASTKHQIGNVEKRVTVVDTPGVSQEMTESEFEELVRAVKMVPEGFDAICLVWDYNNSENNEDKEVQVFQSLHRLFGDKLYKHLVILVTHAQQEVIPEFLEDLPEAMKKITKQCHSRVIAVKNKNKTINQEALRRLFECNSKMSGRRYTTSDLSPLCQIPEGDELGIVLVGKTGVGKSHTGNSITGTKHFRVSDKAKSETKECEQHIREKDRQITVLDTPGVFDTGNVEGICEELCRIVTFFPDGLHAVVLVLRRGRFTREEAGVLRIFQLMFGERFHKHCILLITAKDELTSSEEEYLATVPKNLKKIIEKCHNKCVFFNNVTKDETILRMQLVKLIRLVDDIKNKEGVYTDDLFEEGKKEMNKILQELTTDKAKKCNWNDVTKAMKMKARDTVTGRNYSGTGLFQRMYAKLQSFWDTFKSWMEVDPDNS